MHAVSQDSPSLLKQLFPNPTGNNGWEVVCDVADRLTGDLRKFEEFVAVHKQSIADVNRYFSDSRVRKIVAMLLDTERMNFVSHRTKPEASTTFPDLAACRRVIRFICIAMFHAAGNGRSRDATKLFLVGMRIAGAPISDVFAGINGIGTTMSGYARLLRWMISLAPLLDADDLETVSRGLQNPFSNRAVFVNAFDAAYKAFVRTILELDSSFTSFALKNEADTKRRFQDLAGNRPRFDTAKSETLDFVRRELDYVAKCVQSPTLYVATGPEAQTPDARFIYDVLAPSYRWTLEQLVQLFTELRLAGLFCSAWAFRKRTLTWPARLDDVASKDLCKEIVSEQAFVLEQSPGFDSIRIKSAGLPPARGQERQTLTVPELPKSMLG